ncbi:MAG: 4'-phosphopantetheinyl transferase superfamily protein [Solirubrobacteraceae bacterium]|jgi:4'-phosphopantetheinyl transferase
MDTGWSSRRHADVPAGDQWLGEAERATEPRRAVEKRRADWRLGRFTAKAALGAWIGSEPARVEVLAAADRAPEAWLDGARLPVSVSLSHRGDRALATVCAAPGITGCDLELVEHRSDAFVREWLDPDEQRVLARADPSQRALLANLFWSAKEATSKVRRLGLALDVRRAVVTVAPRLDPPGPRCPWQPLRVDWSDRSQPTTSGWWRAECDWVMVVAGEPAPGPPRELGALSVRGRPVTSTDVRC